MRQKLELLEVSINNVTLYVEFRSSKLCIRSLSSLEDRWADHVTEEALDVQRPRGC